MRAFDWFHDIADICTIRGYIFVILDDDQVLKKAVNFVVFCHFRRSVSWIHQNCGLTAAKALVCRLVSRHLGRHITVIPDSPNGTHRRRRNRIMQCAGAWLDCKINRECGMRKT